MTEAADNVREAVWALESDTREPTPQLVLEHAERLQAASNAMLRAWVAEASK